MKFKVLHTFKHGFSTFEVGNSHDSAALDVADAMVDMWYRAGWVEIEGKPPAPAIDPSRAVTLEVQNVKVGMSVQTPGVIGGPTGLEVGLIGGGNG
jgi:hypothetical protein